jgi:hypothetical protein
MIYIESNNKIVLYKLSGAKSAIRSRPTSHCLYKRHVTQRLSKHGCRVGITRLRLVNPEGEVTPQKALAPSSGMSCRACRSMAAALGLLGFAS